MKNTCGFIIYNRMTNAILIGRVTNSKDLWSIPKGKQENEETLLQAALRETKEESNISEEFITSNVIYQLKPQKYLSGKKRLNAFLSIVEEVPENIKCISFFKDSYGNHLPEFDMLRWVNINELLDKRYNIHYTQHSSVEEAANYINKNKI